MGSGQISLLLASGFYGFASVLMTMLARGCFERKPILHVSITQTRNFEADMDMGTPVLQK